MLCLLMCNGSARRKRATMSTDFTLMLVLLVLSALQTPKGEKALQRYKVPRQGGNSCPSIRTHVHSSDLQPRVSGSYNPSTQILDLQVQIQHLQDEPTTFPVISFSATDFEHSNFDDKYDLQQFVYNYPVRPQGEDVSYYCTPGNVRRYKENGNWTFRTDSCGSITYETSFSVKDEADLFKRNQNATHSFLWAALYIRFQRGAATLDTIQYNISLVTKIGATSSSDVLIIPKYNVENKVSPGPQILQLGGRIDLIFSTGKTIIITDVIQSLSEDLWLEDKPENLKCLKDNKDNILQFKNVGFGLNSRSFIIKYKEYDCQLNKSGPENALEIQLYEYAELELSSGAEIDVAVPALLPANETHFYFSGDFDVTQIKCDNDTLYKKNNETTNETKSFSDIFLLYENCSNAVITYLNGDNEVDISYDIDVSKSRLSPVQSSYKKYQTVPVEVVRSGNTCQVALYNAFRDSYFAYCDLTQDQDVCDVQPDIPNGEEEEETPIIPDTPGSGDVDIPPIPDIPKNDTSNDTDQCVGDECIEDGIERIGKVRLGALGLLALGLLI